MENSYRYFCNKDCQFYPCHVITNGSEFNCLFCFCPLYVLGEECGGNFSYISNTITGMKIKDCSKCTFPHRPESYDIIIDKLNKFHSSSTGIKEEFMFKSNIPKSHKRYSSEEG